MLDCNNTIKISIPSSVPASNEKGEFGVEHFQAVLNQVLEKLGHTPITWDNSARPDLKDDFTAELTVNGQAQTIIFDFIDQAFADKMFWDSEQLGIFLENTHENLLLAVRIGMALHENTDCYALLEVGVPVNNPNPYIQYLDFSNQGLICEAIEQLKLQEHFSKYLNDNSEEQESAPVKIDIERMESALSAESSIVPQGLGREELRKRIIESAKDN